MRWLIMGLPAVMACTSGPRPPATSAEHPPSGASSAEEDQKKADCSADAVREAMRMAKKDKEHGDSQTAREKYRYACTCNFKDACIGLANSLAYDDPPAVDEAMRIYLRLCDEGSGGACTNAGVLYGGKLAGMSHQPDKAAAMFEKGCSIGVPLACAHLAAMYRHGRGVARDMARAVELNERACAANIAEACNNLGDMFETGDGVTRNLERAKSLYEQTCEMKAPAWIKKGDADSAFGCYSLALLYDKGMGVRVDKQKARELMKRACDREVKEACEALKGR